MRLSDNGVSLLELLIVFTLVLLVSSMVWASWSFFDQLAVRTEVAILSDTCTFMRYIARAKNTDQHLIFDTKKNGYSYNNHMYTLAPAVTFGTMRGVKGPPASPSALINSPITFQNNRITFNHTGIISSGSVYFVDKQNRYQYALTNAVSAYSYLRKYRYTNSRWTAFL
jgi:Tfp pilus assembly protein FimT